MSRTRRVGRKPVKTEAKLRKPSPRMGKKPEKPRPIQEPPSPLVKVKVQKQTRIGKGFSTPEIQEAKVPLSLARRLKLKLDRRRSSKHDVNVKHLKDWMSTQRT